MSGLFYGGNMIPSGWIVVIALVVLAGTHTAAFFQGQKYQENETKAETLDETNKAIDQAEKQEDKDSKEVEKQIVIQEKIKIEYRYIKEKANENIDKNPVYSECGLDDDGLRLFNNTANPPAKTEDASKPP